MNVHVVILVQHEYQTFSICIYFSLLLVKCNNTDLHSTQIHYTSIKDWQTAPLSVSHLGLIKLPA